MSNQNRIHLTLSRIPGVTLFRNNVGSGWVGKLVSCVAGRVVLSCARRTGFGLTRGSADLIGWYSMIVTPEMVGKRIAVVLSPECKTGTDRLSDDQIRWMERVRADGGIAFVARDEDESVKYITEWRPSTPEVQIGPIHTMADMDAKQQK